jgi:hypothetical protein
VGAEVSTTAFFRKRIRRRIIQVLVPFSVEKGHALNAWKLGSVCNDFTSIETSSCALCTKVAVNYEESSDAEEPALTSPDEERSSDTSTRPAPSSESE